MNRVARCITTAPGHSSPHEPRTCIGAGEALHACIGELFRLGKFPLPAVCSEAAHPLQVNLNRAGAQMTSFPQLDYCTFAAINRSFIHAWLDGLAQKAFEELSRDAWWLNRSQQGFEGTALDNTRLGIMRLIWCSR